jgi:hypothetical protein
MNYHFMKRILALLISLAGLSVLAYPTYEPFSEYGSLVANNGSNLVCTFLNGVVVAQASSGTVGVTNVSTYDSYLSQAIDFSSGGLTAPTGEPWTTLNFAGTNKNGLAVNGAANVSSQVLKGLDVAVIQDTKSAVFPNSSVSGLLPSTFPGFPPAGTAITNMLENPAQPLIFTGTGSASESPYICGNSAVLNLSQDFTRPASGIKTLYISYLLNVAQLGQLGAGNQGRYLGFICQSNLSAGVNSTTSYSVWSQMFNSYGKASSSTNPYIAYHGLLSKGSGAYYIGACDSSAGKCWATTPVSPNFGEPVFVVGAYVMNASGSDTNFLWANPATGSFGGANPPATLVHAFTMTNPLPDIAGILFLDRPGNGESGGVGTNYIANLIVGSTWSYVTGGPEFTNQPLASTNVNIGQSLSLTGKAVAAAQSVSYHWQKISAGVTNNLSDGAGAAGGAGTVSGSATSTLTISGIGAGDTGTFQLVATASGTSYALTSSQTVVGLADPQIVSSPANASAYYSGSVTFTSVVNTASAPLTYQWYKGSTPLVNGTQSDDSVVTGASGTTSSGTVFSLVLTLSGVSYQDIGNYLLYVTNSSHLSGATAAGTLSVTDPYITAQPVAPLVAAGGNATFTVAGVGSASLTYQWYENGTALSDGNPTATGSATVSGSQTATLTLTGVSDTDNGNYYSVVSSSASSQSTDSLGAVLTVQDPLTVVSTPISRTERSGDHLAFVVGVTGGGPQIQWLLNGNPLTGATNTLLVLTNIQPANGGVYSAVVQNLATTPQTNSATLTVVSNTLLPLYSTNLIVARVGDGAQALSGSTGNTLYFDQYTRAGTYVSTVQIPDEAAGAAYGTGSIGSAGTSPALIVQGAGTDAPLAALLSLSGGNQEFLSFAGYSLSYPFGGSDVTVGATGGAYWRGLGLINAFGVYSLAYTNTGLYSGGNHTIRAAVTLDGTNFWTSGQAGANGIKFVSSAVNSYANGNGIPTLTSSPNGPGSVQIADGNLLFADFFNGAPGIYGAAGTPEPLPANNASTAQLLSTGSGSYPIDFAISPDTNTIYVADGLSGIQRWDLSGGSYSLSYTIQINPNSLYGADSLAVDFSASSTWGPGVTGAQIYATTYGNTTNSLVYLVDTGSGSTPVVLQTAAQNNAFRGVRFGPAALPPVFVLQPQSLTNFPGNTVTFSVAAGGSAPFYYQWYGPNGLITGATNATLTLNGISYGSAGNYYAVISNPTGTNATSANAALTVTAGAPTITPLTLPNYNESVGDHLAFVTGISGTLPITYNWYLNGNPTPVATGTITNVASGVGSLVLTNIQAANAGTYKLVVNNLYGSATNVSGGILTVTASRQTLYPTNLVVGRIGDGAQTLSGATGNTLYLDQYTPAGNYVSTIQIPDEGLGQAYGTGIDNSADLPTGSQSLLFAGAGPDAGYEGLLTRSPNGQSLAFAGYVLAYPFSGADVSAEPGGNGGNNWRGIAEVDSFGYYSLIWTNSGLYSGGFHQIHSAADLDGNGTNFYTTGEAGGGNAVKYANVDFQPASGLGLESVTGSYSGPRVVQVVNGNLAFSDAAGSPVGIYTITGLPTASSTATLLIAETNSPVDFAFSPDGNTVYIADNGAFAGTNNPAGGIQRWDQVSPGSYIYSYTLPTGATSLAGARALTADFSANTSWGSGVTGVKLYAITAETSGNRLIQLVDNGPLSTATTLVTAGAGQLLSGIRFGPSVIAPSFAAQPQSQSVLNGATAVLSANVDGSGPFTYQWYFQAGGVGSYVAITGATNSTYAIYPAGSGNWGNYYVTATNSAGTGVQSTAATLSPAIAPYFTAESFLANGAGFQVSFTGASGLPYSIYTTTNLAAGRSNWSLLTSGSLPGGTNSYTDPNGGVNPQQFYIITSP